MLVASVVGVTVANVLLRRNGAVFDIPTHELRGYWELIFYAGLGIVGAGVALLYSNILYGLEHLFARSPVPIVLKAAFGGLLLGVLALALPELQGSGYPVMELALNGRLALWMALALMFGKILATSLTLGSGGSGGIFAPGLYIGAMMGAAYGLIINRLFPGLTSPAYAYAIIGMGTVFAGATHAPLTSIVILYEMTRDPRTMVPMMFACVIASVLSSRIQYWNINTKKLLNRGVDIEAFQRRKLIPIELEIEPGSSFDGHQVGDLGFPEGMILTRCIDGTQESVPHSSTLLRAGMRIVAVISSQTPEGLEFVRQGVKGPPDSRNA
jgi:chloride channel protein, CIC family